MSLLRQRVCQLEKATAHLPRQVDLPLVADLSDEERAALRGFADTVAAILEGCSRSEQAKICRVIRRALYASDGERRKILNIRDEDLARLPQG